MASWGVRRGGLAAAVVVLVACAARPAVSQQAGAPGDGAAARLVQAALEKELAGQNAQRDALLRRALTESPDHGPAHWHLGYVRLDGRWRTLPEAQALARADERLAEYRKLRARARPTADDQAALARWCRAKRLVDEARVHWLHVLRLQPGHAEAARELGLQQYAGMVLTGPQVALLKAQLQEVRRATSRWRPRVAQWRRAAGPGDAAARRAVLDQIGKIDAPAEMLGLERALWTEVGRKREQQRRFQAMSLELVGVLDRLRHPAAGQALARQAVDSPFDDVRKAAAAALRKRPLDEYVPLLLSGMATPVDLDVRFNQAADGHTDVHYSLHRQGPAGDLTLALHSVAAPATDVMVYDGPFSASSLLSLAAQRQQAELEDRATAVADAAGVQRAVEAANRQIAARNERIAGVLRQAIEVELDADPLRWWSWWRDYNGLAPVEDETGRRPERRVDRTRYDREPFSFSSLPESPPPAPSPGGTLVPATGGRFIPGRTIVGVGGCCFARGTKVWSLTGPVPIAEVRPGDRVLAQDSASGELAYKPVLAVTAREPAPRLRIRLGAAALVAMPGHPFWVAGQGWRLARQLQPGVRLHGLSGGVPVDGLDPVEAPKPHFEMAYNLVVADFATYFVGDRQLLVHDNTPRGPTAAGLPGMKR